MRSTRTSLEKPSVLFVCADYESNLVGVVGGSVPKEKSHPEYCSRHCTQNLEIYKCGLEGFEVEKRVLSLDFHTIESDDSVQGATNCG